MDVKTYWQSKAGHAAILDVFRDPRAACRGIDPRRFEPSLPNFARDIAAAVCASCSVREICLRAALMLPTSEDPDDFRGGTDGELRALMRRDLAKVIKAEKEAANA